MREGLCSSLKLGSTPGLNDLSDIHSPSLADSPVEIEYTWGNKIRYSADIQILRFIL
jgi:hypothetical protein